MLRQIYSEIAKKANFFVSKFYSKKETICFDRAEYFASIKQFVAAERENILLHAALLNAQKELEKLKRRRA